uniref:Uncharacterized protein n=1 Tax=viral metagenome TaxID=1070528 RepID=A0A6C0JWE4_9ZZZZ
MDSLQKNINALEREMQLSQINPIKIIGAIVAVIICILAIIIWWVRPSVLMDDDSSISWVKTGQCILAIGIALLSILWILWNMMMY